MSIYLGNLSIEQIEKRSGVVFCEELKDFMKGKHQKNASDIKPGKWHCFDIPFNLVCGDKETATEIYNYLKDQSHLFKESMQISVQS